MRLIAISDIHGCARTFSALLDQIGLNPSDHLVLGGDYVDRGPDTKGVVDQILSLQEQRFQLTCLKGNHEALMLEAMETQAAFLHWQGSGGLETLQSFNISHPNDLAQEYLQFFKSLGIYYLTEGVAFAHAGFNFKEEDPLSDEVSMMWIRNWYGNLNREWLDDRIIIHGHTPIEKNRIEAQQELLDEFPVLDIDCGCVYDREGMHHLCAYDLTNQKLTFLKNQEDRLAIRTGG